MPRRDSLLYKRGFNPFRIIIVGIQQHQDPCNSGLCLQPPYNSALDLSREQDSVSLHSERSCYLCFRTAKIEKQPAKEDRHASHLGVTLDDGQENVGHEATAAGVAPKRSRCREAALAASRSWVSSSILSSSPSE